jgi:hypothetical protein
MITFSINLSKIDKAHLVKGEKGIYLNLTAIETPNNQYDHDWMVVQGVSKEAREAGEKGPILGNGKNLAPREPEKPTEQELYDLPF